MTYWRRKYPLTPWVEERKEGWYACVTRGDYIVKHGPYRWRLLARFKMWRL